MTDTTSPRANEGRRAGVVEYLLHGIVGIRLVGAAASDVAAVTRQVGPIRAQLGREPDITIRFVARLERPETLSQIGLNDAGFTDHEFFLFRRGARARIDFSQLGEHVEIVCESGRGPVPLLIPIINLAALSNGFVALHASAFVYRETGVVVAGWAKGGKTEALLAFMANGAKYIGDEWIYVSPAERRAFGIPEPMRIWDWHLTHGADYGSVLSRGTQARFRAIKLAGAIGRAASTRLRGEANGGSVARAVSVLDGQLWVQVAPERLFGGTSCVYSGPLDLLFLALSHDSPATEVEEALVADVAPRIAISTEHERLDFLSNYLKFRFAFPGVANPLVERAAALERQLIEETLAGIPAYVVRHPFPADISRLFDAMEPIVLAG